MPPGFTYRIASWMFSTWLTAELSCPPAFALKHAPAILSVHSQEWNGNAGGFSCRWLNCDPRAPYQARVQLGVVEGRAEGFSPGETEAVVSFVDGLVAVCRRPPEAGPAAGHGQGCPTGDFLVGTPLHSDFLFISFGRIGFDFVLDPCDGTLHEAHHGCLQRSPDGRRFLGSLVGILNLNSIPWRFSGDPVRVHHSADGTLIGECRMRKCPKCFMLEC